MHSIAQITMKTAGRSQGLSRPWCISLLPVSDCLTTPDKSYPASSSEPKFATRNQEAGT